MQARCLVSSGASNLRIDWSLLFPPAFVSAADNRCKIYFAKNNLPGMAGQGNKYFLFFYVEGHYKKNKIKN